MAVLTDAEINARLRDLPGWERSGGEIHKTFKVSTYMGGLSYALAVGQVCDRLDHHPTITVTWKRVTVKFTSHDVGNALTDRDFAAAAAVEAIEHPDLV